MGCKGKGDVIVEEVVVADMVCFWRGELLDIDDD